MTNKYKTMQNNNNVNNTLHQSNLLNCFLPIPCNDFISNCGKDTINNPIPNTPKQNNLINFIYDDGQNINTFLYPNSTKKNNINSKSQKKVIPNNLINQNISQPFPFINNSNIKKNTTIFTGSKQITSRNKNIKDKKENSLQLSFHKNNNYIIPIIPKNKIEESYIKLVQEQLSIIKLYEEKINKINLSNNDNYKILLKEKNKAINQIQQSQINFKKNIGVNPLNNDFNNKLFNLLDIILIKKIKLTKKNNSKYYNNKMSVIKEENEDQENLNNCNYKSKYEELKTSLTSCNGISKDLINSLSLDSKSKLIPINSKNITYNKNMNNHDLFTSWKDEKFAENSEIKKISEMQKISDEIKKNSEKLKITNEDKDKSLFLINDNKNRNEIEENNDYKQIVVMTSRDVSDIINNLNSISLNKNKKNEEENNDFVNFGASKDMEKDSLEIEGNINNNKSQKIQDQLNFFDNSISMNNIKENDIKNNYNNVKNKNIDNINSVGMSSASLNEDSFGNNILEKLKEYRKENILNYDC